MTTGYAIGDVLPKDATAQPFHAVINLSTSQLDFALQAGVAASVAQGKNYAFLGVATHKHEDAIIGTSSPGVAIMGRTGSPLDLGGNGQFLWLNQSGAVYTAAHDSYTMVHAGSTGASADTVHSVFGTYNGLSALAASAVLDVEIMTETNDALILQELDSTGGMWISTSSPRYQSMKSMTRSAASQLHFKNKTGGADSTIHFNVWQKV